MTLNRKQVPLSARLSSSILRDFTESVESALVVLDPRERERDSRVALVFPGTFASCPHDMMNRDADSVSSWIVE